MTQTIVDKGTGRLQLTTLYAYDTLGNQTAIRDPLQTVSRSIYDSSGRLTKTIQNCTNSGTTAPSPWETCAGTGTANATWNVTTTYEYDENGNLLKEVAPNGRDTRHAYNGLNQRISTTENYVATTPGPTESLVTSFHYDATGRQIASKTPTADRSTFTVTRLVYDSLGRLTSEIRNCTSTGETLPADPAACTGGGTQDADTNVTVTYTYDGAGNKLSQTSPKPSDAAGGTSTVITRYAYDGAGRLCRVNRTGFDGGSADWISGGLGRQ